jgi:hypothetical protein
VSRTRPIVPIVLFLAFSPIGNRTVGASPPDCNADGTPDSLETHLETPQLLRSEYSSQKVLAGDVNGDGDPDVVGMSNSSQQVILSFNHEGSFEPPRPVPAGVLPFDMTLADLSNDGTLEVILVGDREGAAASIHPTSAWGVQAAVTRALPAGLTTPWSVAAGDLDGDRDIDLAAAISSEAGSVAILLNTGSFSFSDGGILPAGRMPETVRTADLDGDGDLDLAVSHEGENNVAILANSGGGTFEAARWIESQAGCLEVADLDGDGGIDLLVGQIINASWSDTSIAVLHNEGGRRFAAASPIEAGICPKVIFASDLDGDGDKDLAVADWLVDSLVTLRNEGNGAFRWDSVFSILKPYDVGGADLDGDRAVDLVVASDGTPSVLRNSGSARFPAARVFPATYRCGASVAADLDGDGPVDIAAVNQPDDKVTFFRNDGEGALEERGSLDVGEGPRAVASGDLDGDGRLDLAVANLGSEDISILFSLGGGSFGAAKSLAFVSDLSPVSLVATDLNGDGRPDLAVTGGKSLGVILSRGGGEFDPVTAYPDGVNLASIAAADFDGDGDLDLATSNHVFLNGGNGSLTRKEGDSLTGSRGGAVACADFDGDGRIDLACAPGLLRISWNDGKANFGSSEDDLDLFIDPGSVLAVDLDGDGSADILTDRSSTVGNFSIFLDRGGRSFTQESFYPLGRDFYPVAAEDLERDGRPDIILAANGDLRGIGVVRNRSEPGSGPDRNRDGVPDECQGAFLRGDVDGNGRVNLSDTIRVLAHLFQGRFGPPCVKTADADDDGTVSITDAVFGLAFLFSGGSPLPAPGPSACGPDPTPDPLPCPPGAFTACP